MAGEAEAIGRRIIDSRGALRFASHSQTSDGAMDDDFCE